MPSQTIGGVPAPYSRMMKLAPADSDLNPRPLALYFDAACATLNLTFLDGTQGQLLTLPAHSILPVSVLRVRPGTTNVVWGLY